VDKGTGTITGLQDSGDIVSNPAADSLLHITRIPGNTGALDGVDFVVSYENTLGGLSQQLWGIQNSGLAFLRGVGASGLNLRGSKPVSLPGQRQAILPMNGSGYALVTSDNGLTMDFSTWDFQKPFLDPLFVPHRLSDNSRDQLPGIGLDIGAVPTLTDGSYETIENGATQKVRAMLTDGKREQDLGIGGGAIVDVLPANEFKSVGIASVTKVMTLLLAVEAAGNGEVNFNDIVEVSENAASTPGSSMDLVAGEKQTLSNLLYGMMMVSGNDAAVAIAEHVAGNETDFVARMNQRATDLGMADTWYNQPAGGGYSTPQDQITLFRFGSQHPDFLRFATERFYVACGELANGDPVCRNVDKFKDNGYPGLNGWKNGNLGFHDPAFKKAGVPLCTSCLIIQVVRGGRTMLVGLQQSGNRWKDAGALLDYGYRRLWTPDSTASLGILGSTYLDIALDYIDSTLAVTATLTPNNELELCSWSVLVDAGQIDRLTPCTQQDYSGMVGDPNISVPPDLVDGVQLSSAFSEGDYMTVMLGPSGSISGRLWRVGPDAP
ncbi:MAG TPA: D-alanyl-D-alanine carboxypeptidase, partial [Chromatiales bacterium]|nr:D-alanyl-D-alanine carboxypeptidase [Chromatiales bacterium]